jgi:HlyD family secretion protein
MGMDRTIEKKKWPPKRIIKYAAIGVFVLVVLYLLLFQTGTSTLNVKAEHITISSVTKAPFQEYIPIIGNVEPIVTHYLGAAEGGRVDKIFIEAGAMVKEGDKILQLSNTNLLLDVMYREAELYQQSNNLRNTRLLLEQNRLDLKRQLAELDYNILAAKKKYERYEVLFKEDLVSRQEYDEIKDEYEYLLRRREIVRESQETDLKFREQQVKSLESSLKRMDDNLGVARQKLEDMAVKAPISGHLTSLEAEIGQSKAPGDQLGVIHGMGGFRVRAQIDEYYIDRVKGGKIGEFDNSGKAYQLKVAKIYPEVTDGRFEVDLTFVNDTPPGIRRGQTFHIRLQLGELSEAILLARGGFYQKTGGNWAYVVDSAGKSAVKRDIRLGRQNPQFFEVLGGLEPGERVITSSYDNFGDMERLILK